MKRIATVVTVLLAVLLIGVFCINSNTIETDVTKEKTKVGVVFNSSIDDKSWGQSHYEGLEQAAEELNLQMVYKENVPETQECKEVMEELIQEGCQIIIGTSYGFGPWELQVADEYPEIYFFHATGSETADNLATFSGRMYQMSYLCGIVAGLQTETDAIGYVAAEPITEVNRGINAFTLGVRSVNPEAYVYVTWSGSWTEEESNRRATMSLLEAYPAIDVLTSHTDSQAPLDEADARGIGTIGYNIDNSAYYPNTYLTAPVWNWEAFYRPRILECLQGKFKGTHYWEDTDSGVIDLAPLTGNVKAGTREAVEAARKILSDGTFDVFYGPIRDNEGNLQVGEGESMTDETMLEHMDWYVEGVVIHET
jgi:basic membrane protein A